jgi:hypothetical protein
MDESRVMSEMVRKAEVGRGKRVAILVVAAVLVAVLVGVVVVGFRGRHISQNAAAMTRAVPTSGNVGKPHSP